MVLKGLTNEYISAVRLFQYVGAFTSSVVMCKILTIVVTIFECTHIKGAVRWYCLHASMRNLTACFITKRDEVL